MGQDNHTSVSEFLLLGLSERPEQQWPLFGLFLSMYTVTIVGNLLIILAIYSDSHLHTPMYFFLSNLSIVDLCQASTTTPKMLINILTHSKAIPYAGCLIQMYSFHLFGTMDSFLLAVMAYDRFVAICHPLRYATIMSPQLCILFVGGPWGITNLQSVVHTSLMAKLTFCADNKIPHFFCDLMPLLKLSCSDTHINELVVLVFGIFMGISPLVCILLSYICIFRAVLRVPSAEGKRKAFSTCGSHLTVVLLFYGTIFAVYLQPSGPTSPEKDKAAAVMCAVVIPMLNPFIYSLRNRDMKGALRKLISRTPSSQ
ncbi:olfactory receptor 1I1 [Vombatus ursinus]|uniref:olfactory receptor 1I1 n=1 Tax=Vombatus ursinus TaxID=29139 RepID=UPI000FFDA2F4|nr:olfactory receptor 1I1 [Vombatus ursinus]